MSNPIRGLGRRARRMTWLGRLALMALPAAVLAATMVPAVGASAAQPAAGPGSSMSRCSTGYLTSALHLAHVAVDSAVLDTTGRYTPPGTATPITELPSFCAVALAQTDAAGNSMHIAVWLPAKWNGRFQGIGGGGFSCGIFYAPIAGLVSPSLKETVTGGYASASTDCGVPVTDAYTGTWGLKPDGKLNRPLITDWASAGIHDMTVAGKAVTQAYYRGKLRYSYFDGCSTGGREALMEAQRYPADYNGIVAGSPAINWPSWVPAALWPALVMSRMHDALPTCKENAFTESAVKACDARDGVTDGIISDPADCRWNADHLIGFKTPCGTITATDAAVMNKIWQGPETTSGRPLWHGLERGASLDYVAVTATTHGVTTPQPFSIPLSWLGTWLQKNPDWNWKTLTYAQFDQLFAQSVREFSTTLATDNPDLTAFHAHGGKILIWHGLADGLIPPHGTIQYYQRVQHAMGAAKTDSFARLFLAPGAQHCADAAGPAPANPLAAVVKWVERGQAPQSVPAALTDSATGVVTLSRPLCAYPRVARYDGHGSTDLAQDFACAPAYEAG
ncbi:MAG TPA: tannase/feruloyl esterase family alpha/beta hydrolase [Trebonia sp.]